MTLAGFGWGACPVFPCSLEQQTRDILACDIHSAQGNHDRFSHSGIQREAAEHELGVQTLPRGAVGWDRPLRVGAGPCLHQPPIDRNEAPLEVKPNTREGTTRGAFRGHRSPRRDETRCHVPDLRGAGAAVPGMPRVTPASLRQADTGDS